MTSLPPSPSMPPRWAILLSGALLFTSLFAPIRAHPSEAKVSDDRAQFAPPPTAGLLGGWRDIALRVYRGISDDRILATAAGVTFYVLLAIFPGIAALISLYGLVADSNTVAEHISGLSGLLPEGRTQIIGDQLNRLAAAPAHKLGLALIGGLLVLLWSANGGVKAMFDALNVVYEEKEERGFFKLNAISLALTIAALLFSILSLLTLTVVPSLLSYLGFAGATDFLVKVGRWPILFGVSSLFIATIYRFGPSRQVHEWRWISPGCILAATAWIAVSLLFSWYAENIGSFNRTYGSLGAAVGFMTWVWLSVIVILLGAKLNAEMERFRRSAA